MHTEGIEGVPKDTYKTTLHAQHTARFYIFSTSRVGATKYLTESYIH